MNILLFKESLAKLVRQFGLGGQLVWAAVVWWAGLLPTRMAPCEDKQGSAQAGIF